MVLASPVIRGVALVTASKGVQWVVISAGQEASSTARAVRAGLRKLSPMPPKSCLTTMMAKNAPIITIHQGADGVMHRPSSRPVTTAEKSLMRTV